MAKKGKLAFTLILLLLTACGKKWDFTVESTYKEPFSIDRSSVSDLAELKDEDSTCEGIPLEIVLYQQGIEVIESIQIMTSEGQVYELGDKEIIDQVCVSENGTITYQEEQILPESMMVNEKEFVQTAAHIQDVTASAAYALGLDMENLAGETLVEQTYDHVVLLFLDGFGYYTFELTRDMDMIPNILEGSSIIPAITIYPPRTSTSSAAVMTGLMPNQSGVFKSGIRSTEAITIFDIAAENGLTSVAIEGEAMAFNMRNTEVILSGDRDMNGSTDDNTFSNAKEKLQEYIPDLIWIHFHGIDDRGHTYGPNTDEIFEKVIEIDEYVRQIEDLLPEKTLIIIFADHGMHSIQEEDELGNHGNLIYSDMAIPIILKTK